MAASVDNPSHLIETAASPVFFLSVYDNENRRELHSVHAGNINAVLPRVGAPPLHYAIRSNNVELVKILLRNGADVNLRDDAGDSPLLLNLNCSEIFHLLLESAADVNARDPDGRTALHLARRHSMVKELLRRGADTNVRDNHGRTPLAVHWPWSLLSEDNSIVTELLHWGAEIDKGSEGVVFLLVKDAACGMELLRRVLEGHTHIRNSVLCTPLHWAVRAGRAELVRVLLDCGASVEARDKNGHTPLRTAVDCRCGVEMASELVRRGADVNSKCDAGHTLLRGAFLDRSEALVGLLLSAGADPDVLKHVPPCHPCAPLVMKHSVLRNYASRWECAESSYPWRDNSRTCTQCMSEIGEMNRIRLSEEYTLYDVAFGNKWDISCARKVYEFMSSGQFPMYSGLAMTKLALNVKKHLGDRANNNSLFMQSLSKKSSFRTNQHVLLQIVKYLSDEDCLTLYIAGS